MVRYGAEMVFSSEATNITDADVEALIAKGEKDTAALNAKMQQFTENAKAFTLDGGMQSVYDFKDEDEDQGPDFDFKTLVGNNWVDPPKRERKRLLNYNEDMYKANQKSGKQERGSGPRLPKMPQLLDFQFFDTMRLTQLFDKEHTHELYKSQLAEKEKTLRNQVSWVGQGGCHLLGWPCGSGLGGPGCG